MKTKVMKHFKFYKSCLGGILGSTLLKSSLLGGAFLYSGSTFSQITTKSYVVSTVAGSGAEGFRDGTNSSARFLYPSGVWADASGNILVTDQQNHRIRKVYPNYVYTISGTGAQGLTNGNGYLTRYSIPNDICMDGAGNMYVVDMGNNVVRKITSSNVSSTFASGFSFPRGITIDAAGNLYVSENYKIYKITSAGVVTLLAGSSQGYLDGTGAAAKFNGIADLAIDASGNLYVTDVNNYRIRKVTQAGVVTTFAGSGVQGYQDGTGTSAKFSYAYGITIDASGNLYVADGTNGFIRKITPGAVVTTFAGNGSYGFTDGLTANARFAFPYGVHADALGNIFVADKENNRIRKISLENATQTYTFATCLNAASLPQSFQVSGANLTANVTVTAPAGYEVSTSPGGTYSTSLVLAKSGTVLPNTTVYVRMKSNASLGILAGNVTCVSAGQTTKNIAVTGNVASSPYFTLFASHGHDNYPSQIVTANSTTQNTYSWSPTTNINNISNWQTVSFNSSTPSNYTYTVTATGPSGCTSTNTITVTKKKEGVYFDSYIDLGVLTQGNNNSNYDEQNNSTINGFGNDYNHYNFLTPSDDIFYKFTITQTSNVTVQHCNVFDDNNYIADSYLSLFDENQQLVSFNDDPQTNACTSSNLHAKLTRNLLPGTYYVASEGYDVNTGKINTKVSIAPCAVEAGYDIAHPVIIEDEISAPCYYYSITDNVGRCFNDVNGDDGPEIYYKFSVFGTQTVTFSTCNSELSDLALYLMDGSGNPIQTVFNNAPCNSAKAQLTRTLTTGDYIIAAQANYDYVGNITLEITTPGSCRKENIQANNAVVNKKSKESLTSAGAVFNVYPNPSTGLINVNADQDGALIVNDLMGREVYRKPVNASTLYEINLGHLSKGIYNVKVEGSKFSKIINLQ